MAATFAITHAQGEQHEAGMNFATAAMRNAVGPLGAVLAFLAGETRRYDEHRAAAMAWSAPLPPKGMKRVQEALLCAENFHCTRVGPNRFTVTEKILGGISHSVTISPDGCMPKCTCGVTEAKREPCDHVIITSDNACSAPVPNRDGSYLATPCFLSLSASSLLSSVYFAFHTVTICVC